MSKQTTPRLPVITESRFQKAILNAAQVHINEIVDENRDTLAASMHAHLFNGEPVGNRNIEPTQVFQYFWKLFKSYTEITKTLETLDNISVFIRRFPFARSKVSPESYLQFHIEAYLSEVYILRERSNSLVKLVERQFKRDPHLTNVNEVCQQILNLTQQTLGPVVDVRSNHVHKVRFQDDDISRLETLNLLKLDPTPDRRLNWDWLYKHEYKKTRKKWTDQIKTNNKASRELIDQLLEAIYPIIFDQDGHLRIPNGIRD